jgi:type II secretory pathway component PulC
MTFSIQNITFWASSRFVLLIGGCALGCYGLFLYVNLQAWTTSQDFTPAPIIEVNRTAKPGSPAMGEVVDLFGLTSHQSGPTARSVERLEFVGSYRSNEPAASFVVLAASGIEKVYRVGELLPGGSQLRRVEPGRAVLWYEGREQVLELDQTPVTLIPSTGKRGQLPLPTPLQYMRAIDAAPTE